jgi:hypothetical protein
MEKRQVIDANKQVLEISASSISIVQLCRSWVDVVRRHGLSRRMAQVFKDEIKQSIQVAALLDRIGVLVPQNMRLKWSVVNWLAGLVTYCVFKVIEHESPTKEVPFQRQWESLVHVQVLDVADFGAFKEQ